MADVDTFEYQIEYTDDENHAPESGHPVVHILKGGSEITGSPFAMTEMNASDMTYTDGKDYNYTIMFDTAGDDYSYYFSANDSLGMAAPDTSSATGPDVEAFNHAPTLTSASVTPATGYTTDTFEYKVTYTDADNDGPEDDYPKLHIMIDGVGIANSPFEMTAFNTSDTTYTDGAIFTYTPSSLAADDNYTYYIEAYDAENQYVVTDTFNGPVVNANTAPTLTNPSVDPTSGYEGDSFTYNITYTDLDDDAPDGYPVVHVMIDGTEIDGSPFDMEEADSADTTYTDGKVYTKTITLDNESDDYEYYFEAEDVNGAHAPPTSTVNAPDVDAVPTVQNGAISGTLVDEDGEPISGVTVTVVGTSLTATTGSDGTFNIADVPPDTYDLTFSKEGYETQTVEDVVVTEGTTTALDQNVVLMAEEEDDDDGEDDLTMVWIIIIIVIIVVVLLLVFMFMKKKPAAAPPPEEEPVEAEEETPVEEEGEVAEEEAPVEEEGEMEGEEMADEEAPAEEEGELEEEAPVEEEEKPRPPPPPSKAE
jgi:hypothetical protein